MATSFLELRGLTVGYERGQPTVRDLSLGVAEGELVSLLGPSGCGKTTTMRAISGLLQPDAGNIVLAGRDITQMPASRRDIGLVFQSYALFPHLSVAENIGFGLRLRKVPASERQKRVAEAIRAVSLDGFENRLPAQLSGGQQQRVALARAFVIRPRLLLLDEPLSNLDARLRLEMRAELRRIQSELGITMLYVTHDQSEALALSDRVVVMNAGRIEQQAAPETIYRSPETPFVAAFMGFENLFRLRDGKLERAGATLALPEPPPPEITHLAWRPEAVIIGLGSFTGRVVARGFQGEVVEYLLDTSIGAVKAVVPAAGATWREGETVTFELPINRAAHIRARG